MKEVRNIKLEHVYTIWGLVVIFWALYRVYIFLPEWVDEGIFKPIIFLGPALAYVLVKEKARLKTVGWQLGKWKRDILFGLGFGALFMVEGIAANAAKYGKLSLNPKIPLTEVGLIQVIVFSLTAAFIEETLVRGFLYTRLRKEYKSEIKALVYSALMYLVILVPVIFTRSHLEMSTLVIFVVTNLVMSFANTMIFQETKTLTVPILIHAFWNVAVGLYI